MTNSKNGFSKILKSNVPDGPIDKKWTSHKNKINLVSPANKRNLDVIVVDGGSDDGTWSELRAMAKDQEDGKLKVFPQNTLGFQFVEGPN